MNSAERPARTLSSATHLLAPPSAPKQPQSRCLGLWLCIMLCIDRSSSAHGENYYVGAEQPSKSALFSIETHAVCADASDLIKSCIFFATSLVK